MSHLMKGFAARCQTTLPASSLKLSTVIIHNWGEDYISICNVKMICIVIKSHSRICLDSWYNSGLDSISALKRSTTYQNKLFIHIYFCHYLCFSFIFFSGWAYAGLMKCLSIKLSRQKNIFYEGTYSLSRCEYSAKTKLDKTWILLLRNDL